MKYNFLYIHFNKIFLLAILMWIIPINLIHGDECVDWFQNSGVKPNTPNCLLTCETLIVDMSTFYCHSRCPEFCKPAPKCKHDPFWQKKILNGRPAHWPLLNEKDKPWSKDEKERLLSTLDQIPDDLKSKVLVGIFRMSKSVQLINPGSESDDAIVLYDNAFEDPYPLGRVVSHELAHIWYANASRTIQRDYELMLGWKIQNKDDQQFKVSPDRQLIDPDSSESPQEDFAHNLDTYLFDPQKLKSYSPKAFDWIKEHFSKNFNLKEKCKNEK